MLLQGRNRVLVAAICLAVLVLASQALAAATAPTNSSTIGTAKAVGHAGFAYLGGLRVFAAAVLWNRLEPQFHGYYQGVPLDKQDYIIPTLVLVQTLDPQFERSYYLSSYFVSRRVNPERGIGIARQGLANNPDSGLMKANLTQLLYLRDKVKYRDETLRLAESALDTRRTYWIDQEDRFEGYAVFRDVFLSAGDEAKAATISDAMLHMRESGIGTGDHDHDGDGVQDH